MAINPTSGSAGRNRRRSVLAAAALVLLAVSGAFGLNRFITDLSDPAPLPTAAGPGDAAGTVLCLGDSLTRGNCSANYVDELSRRLSNDGIAVVNAGINGDMVHDLIARLEDALENAPPPDTVTILVGTNDANATLDPRVAKRALEESSLGRVPVEPVYRELYVDLIARVRAASDAPIILISIPPIGEIPGSREWTRSSEYAAAVEEIAAAEDCAFVPFFETLAGRIEADPPDPRAFPPHAEWGWGMAKAIFRRHILGMDYRAIGAVAGYRYHSDQLHLNEAAALLLADALEPAVREALGER